LGEFVAEIGEGDARPIVLEQPINAILTAPTACLAGEAQHGSLSGGFGERIGTVGYSTILPRFWAV
jgi:hypothetical protein